MVKKTKVEVFMENIYCPNCKTILERDSVVFMTHPPQYEYFCDKCSHNETSIKCYPLISYEERYEGEESTRDEKIKEIITNNEILMQKSKLCTNYVHDEFDKYGYKG